MTTTTNRERLEGLRAMLDEAPFDARALRRELADTSHLTEIEADALRRHALRQLSRAGFALFTVDTTPLPPAAADAYRQALDWISSARSVLLDHTLN